ncbi:MAG: hypothetical protein IJ588_01615 [Prevotella sp.]|nr:hypothetical protein [Prevotella sp.]
MEQIPSNIKQQYLSSWRSNYINYINRMHKEITALIALPNAKPIDKEALDAIKLLFQKPEINAILEDLSNGETIKKSTLDSIERIDKELADLLIEYLQKSDLLWELFKRNAHYSIEFGKQLEILRLSVLQISIVD